MRLRLGTCPPGPYAAPLMCLADPTEDETSMNKTELIEITAEDSGLACEDAAKVIDSMLATVTSTLIRGGDVTIPGFGKVLNCPARCSHRPQPGYRRRA